VIRSIVRSDSALRAAIAAHGNFLNYTLIKIGEYSEIDGVLSDGLLALRMVVKRT
jgi:hypothetical protein